MSVIHVNQIRAQIKKLYTGKIDLSDVNATGNELDNFFLSRGLAAYTVQFLAATDMDGAASSVTDGGGDNGIDALYYDDAEKVLYLVQAKWIHSGIGEPENGEVKKFVSGVRDLFNMRFERFNQKVNAKKDIVVRALNDPYTKYVVAVSYTGLSRLAEPSARDLDDLATEMNDPTEVLRVTPLNQSDIHTSLTVGLTGEPINLDIGVKAWGRVQEPQAAYYGQLNAVQIVDWWTKYRTRLFAKNLRGVLGDTDVNNEMRYTLEHEPKNFWYFNNGITIIAKKVTKTMAGGGDTDFGTFHCEDASIVNGAQTVGTIGRFGEGAPEKLEKVHVPIRVISVEGGQHFFGETVTKTNNRQNRIESRDFVTLDPEQARIKTELAIDNIDYHVMRAESYTRSETAFDLVEGTTALACASGKVHLVVQLKREIGKLWEDIAKAPYKELFNRSVAGMYLWRCVRAQRLIDKTLESIIKAPDISGRDYGIAVHGNRIIAALALETLHAERFPDPNFRFEDSIDDLKVASVTVEHFHRLKDSVEGHYGNAIIPTLFKNLTKCKHLVELARSA